MALTLNADTDRIVSLEEYVEHMEREVDFDDMESVIASAPMLRALSNNSKLMPDFLNSQFENWPEFQVDNSYTAQTLLLSQRKEFVVRTNLWEPPAQDAALLEYHNQLYYYLVPHDHTFSFMTVGHYGSGYVTTIYECDPEKISGIPGDDADIVFAERTTLPRGKVMFYRAGRDIHSQEHPEEFSISLNLLINEKGQASADQHYFDLENRKIVNVVKGNNSSRIMFCRLARFVGDATTTGYLEQLRDVHPGCRVRLAATESLAARDPANAASIWAHAADDKHPFVRWSARQVIEHPEDNVANTPLRTNGL